MIDWNHIGSYNLKGGYKKGHIEKDFQAEIFRNMRRDGYYAKHIPDIGLSTRFLDGICKSPKGELFAIEFKKIKGNTFNISSFEPSQIDLLLEWMHQENNDNVRIMIYSIKHNKYVTLKFSDIWNNKNNKGGVRIF